MKILFDIDNTLYSFEESGFELQWFDNIKRYLRQTLAHLPEEELMPLCTKYYNEYGLTITGLAENHRTEGIDLWDYCRRVNTCESYEAIMKPDHKLQEMLAALEEAGHELWYFTNADVEHARRVLDAVGCTKFFTINSSNSQRRGREGDEDAEPTLRGIDCFMQWEAHAPHYKNKPMREAFEFAQSVVDPTGEAARSRQLVMIDDGVGNLAAPKALGWHTVWVSHGKQPPPTAATTAAASHVQPAPTDDCEEGSGNGGGFAHHVVRTIHDLKTSVIDRLQQ